jgi:starch synthase
VHKGLPELVEAVRRLPPGLGARLWVVGDPPNAASEAALAGSDVERRPHVPFAEAPWYFAACDVLVTPNRATPFGVHQVPAKLLHAIAVGTCVVASSVGDIPDVLGGSPPAGVLVPPDDPEALCAALVEILADPGRREALGREARRRAEELYSWNAMEVMLEEELARVGVS